MICTFRSENVYLIFVFQFLTALTLLYSDRFFQLIILLIEIGFPMSKYLQNTLLEFVGKPISIQSIKARSQMD